MSGYASMIVLEKEGEDVVLLLEWIDFPAKTHTTCFHRMSGAAVRLLLDFD